jgi:ribosomal protein S18 acetylase RimI-like enzyme
MLLKSLKKGVCAFLIISCSSGKEAISSGMNNPFRVCQLEKNGKLSTYGKTHDRLKNIEIQQICEEKQELSENKNLSFSSVIDDYQPTDEPVIEKIAKNYMFKLVNGNHFEWDEKKAWEEEILNALESPNIISKVYRINGVAVGFISFYIKQPGLLMSCMPALISGPKGYICHLAVSEDHQGKSVGRTLLDDALKACEEESVRCIELGTTGPYPAEDLKKFYKAAGFEIVDGRAGFGPSNTPYADTRWIKQIKPDPLEWALWVAVGASFGVTAYATYHWMINGEPEPVSPDRE